MLAAPASNLRAYDSWAATYPPTPHNPLMRAEQQAMLDLWPDVEGARALDLACGTGRYGRLLADRRADLIVSLDFSGEMLRRSVGPNRVRGSMMELPFAGAAFDVVVSGLAIGHAPQITRWMCESARVLAHDGLLLYSDFHPAASAAGMIRSFTDEQQRKHILSHNRFDLPEHHDAAATAGLTLESMREVRVGIEMREEFPGCEDFYRQWMGLPIVLVVRARK
jgi:ubiquinone/menaquinone biosynthesis C-methylase UbiE